MSVWRQTGKKPKELEELIELPDSCQQVWSWFLELNSSRSGNGFGPNPLNYSEILSYFTLLGTYPEQWELGLIKRFDLVAMEYFAKEQEKNQKY